VRDDAAEFPPLATFPSDDFFFGRSDRCETALAREAGAKGGSFREQLVRQANKLSS
jgi:hypothetical protein